MNIFIYIYKIHRNFYSNPRMLATEQLEVRVARTARADRQMRDTLAWPLSSWTASQIMQRCVRIAGTIWWRRLYICRRYWRVRVSRVSLPSRPVTSGIIYNPFQRIHPVVCVFICRALPLLPRPRIAAYNAFDRTLSAARVKCI